MNTAISRFRCQLSARVILCVTVLLTLDFPAVAADTSTALPWIEAKDEPLPVLRAGEHVFRFTGAGGFFLGDGNNAILVDPFLTNPGMWPVLSLQTLKTDTALIDRYLPMPPTVAAILVGHAHYDHAMDIPYVVSRLPATVRILGSETLDHILAPQVLAPQRLNVEPHMARSAAGGEWIPVTPRLRVFPIASEHSPHIGSFVAAGGKLHQALQKLPADSLDWKAGTTLSYLVDFLDTGGQVGFRVFVQTSSANPPNGVPPKAVLDDGYPVNVAVLCAANFNNVANYPDVVLAALQPNEVVIVHWERFWEPWLLNKGVPLPGLDLDAFVARIRSAAPNAEVRLPQRGAQFLLQPYEPAGGNPHGR